jgi:hypothetical protein
MVQSNFLTYCNTIQFFTNKWKGDVFDNSFYLSDLELQRWNVSRRQVEAMPQIKTIGLNKYNVLNVSEIDISLIKPHGRKLTELHKYMMQCIVKTELPTSIQTMPYWNTFLKHRARFAELFFTVDEFAGRVHSPISGMSKDIRPYLMIQGEKTVSFDVAQMQPTLLANILFDNIGENDFSSAIFEGIDIYSMLQQKAGLSTRNEAKKLFFQMLFGRPSNDLERLFEKANFIQWINWYKSETDHRNPHGKEKTYSNLAFLLQTYEVNIMSEIWQNLAQKNIPFLTVHDEIIARQTDTETVKTTIESVLNKHFKSYKLNINKLEGKANQQQEPAPAQTPKKLLSDIAIDLIGIQNNMSKENLLIAMIQKYNITDTRAAAGVDKMLESNLISEVHFGGLYYLTNSTPF